jgi:hypothetical protein
LLALLRARMLPDSCAQEYCHRLLVGQAVAASEHRVEAKAGVMHVDYTTVAREVSHCQAGLLRLE